MLENPQVAKELVYDYRVIKSKEPRKGWMEFGLRCWQNNKKIGPILAINNEDFNNQYVAEKTN